MLSYIYRSLNQSLIDTEKLLKLLDEPTEVNDQPNAPDILVTKGEIKFENVTFSYDDRATALNGVSFTVPAGQSVALVGESGSGKSTILRLLYRFYDLKDGEGRILIDGQDIRDVTQASLRRAIGVVPQDSVLFNASIEYNVGCVPFSFLSYLSY
jgi:ABC-type transport system involved in Fe-S cluster assembly fused permease/ATPase subunit